MAAVDVSTDRVGDAQDETRDADEASEHSELALEPVAVVAMLERLSERIIEGALSTTLAMPLVVGGTTDLRAARDFRRLPGFPGFPAGRARGTMST